MAAGASKTPVGDGSTATGKAIELAIDLPHCAALKLHLHLTIFANSILLFLTSTGLDTIPSAASMGSFVYALPDRYTPSQPMSTALYIAPSSLDFATRIAKVLTTRLKKPCYVGSSVNLSGASGGGSVEEEMEAFRSVVDTVVSAASTGRVLAVEMRRDPEHLLLDGQVDAQSSRL